MAEIKVRRKKNDIQKLMEILMTINEIKKDTSNSNLVKILIEIGKLAGGISFNNKDSDCIRNKYGYIQRVNESKIEINEGGIHFKKLYQLNQALATLSESEKESTFSDSENKNLISDLSNLQKIVVHILCQENGFSSDSELEKRFEVSDSSYDPKEHNLLYIIKISSERYQKLAFTKIKEELTSLENLDFNKNDDVYYFARIFIIMGELLHEIIEDETIQTNKELLNAFKNLNNTRDILIHHHKHVEEFGESKDEMEKLILHVKQDLLTIIQNDEEKTISLNYNDSKTIQSLKVNSKRLNEVIKFKPAQIQKPRNNVISKTNSTSTELIKSLNKLKNLIINAAKAFDLKNPVESLDKLNLEYQELKKQLYTETSQGNMKKLNEEVTSYPESLSQNIKEIIINLAEKIKKEREQNKLIQKKKLDDENKHREKMKTRCKIKDILKKIDEELKYLREIEQRGHTNKKQEYIMDHIVSLIGQYRRDLDDAYYKIDQLENELIFPTPTNLSLDASISARNARSNELVHDIFSLNRESLQKRIQDDIFPAYKHFNSIFTIYDYEYCHDKDIPRSPFMYFQLGGCSIILDMKDRGIKYFEEGLKVMEEVNSKEYYLSNIEFNRQNNGEDGREIDMNRLYLTLIRSLALCYKETQEHDKVYELLKPIYEKIKLLEKPNILYIRSFVSKICYSIAICLHHRQDNEYELALKLGEKFANSLSSYITGIYVYIEVKKYKEATSLIDCILKDRNLDPFIKFQLLIRKYNIIDKNFNGTEYINAIKDLLSELNHFKEMQNVLKEKIGDDFVFLHILTIKLELDILFENIQLVKKTQNFDLNLIKRVTLVEEKFNSLINSIKIFTPDITEKFNDLYVNFTIIFSNMVSVVSSEIEFEEMFNKAQDYFQKVNITSKSECVFYLANACRNYARNNVPKTESKKRIQYLKQAIEILKPYNDQNKNDILVNDLIQNLLMDLGFEHFSLGSKYISSDLENAIENYSKSKQYFLQMNHNYRLYIFIIITFVIFIYLMYNYLYL